MQTQRSNASVELRPNGEPETRSATGCFVRLLWLATNVAPIVLAATIARQNAGVVSLESGLLWAAVVAAIGLHYYEVTRTQATTLGGKPATISTWRSYALRMLAFAAVIWGIALWFD